MGLIAEKLRVCAAILPGPSPTGSVTMYLVYPTLVRPGC